MVATIHDDPRTSDRRLNQYFNSTRAQWIDVIKAAVQARARITDDHAKSAPGYHAWDAATARARQIFRREGWERGDYDGIETIINHELKKMIAVMNTDSGTADRMRSPKNRTWKGQAAKNVIDLNNQGELFKREEMGPGDPPPYSLWYLCIFDDGAKVRAEISRPSEYSAGYVSKFGERIFILCEGDWEKVAFEEAPDADPSQDFEINVVRK